MAWDGLGSLVIKGFGKSEIYFRLFLINNHPVAISMAIHPWYSSYWGHQMFWQIFWHLRGSYRLTSLVCQSILTSVRTLVFWLRSAASSWCHGSLDDVMTLLLMSQLFSNSQFNCSHSYSPWEALYSVVTYWHRNLMTDFPKMHVTSTGVKTLVCTEATIIHLLLYIKRFGNHLLLNHVRFG